MNLIPYALHVPSNELIDVKFAENGRNCECICPSCKTPVIARQGTKNEWCFAHDSKYNEEQAYKNCEYSIFVAMKLMIQQLLSERKTLQLPRHEVKFPQYSDENLVVTTDNLLHIDEVQIPEARPELILVKNDVPIHVYITYPSFEALVSIPRRYNKKPNYGILEINVSKLNYFKGYGEGYASFTGWLIEVIETSGEGKKWIYHPREILLEGKARMDAVDKRKQERNRKRAFREKKRQQHSAKPIIRSPQLPPFKGSITSNQTTKYYRPNQSLSVGSVPIVTGSYANQKQKSNLLICRHCKHKFTGLQGHTKCPTCKSHLYVGRCG